VAGSRAARDRRGQLASPAIVITGDVLSTLFASIQYQAQGGTQPAAITIDGGTLVNGSVTFFEPHGESNFNTADISSDYLIGATSKFGAVKIVGGDAWGHGDFTNWQRDFVRIVAARNVVVENVLAANLSTSGYTRSMIRLETTFPTAGDIYSFKGLLFDANGGTGVMYSDASGLVVTAGDHSNRGLMTP
jgi:hypothetical protein